MNPDRFDHPGLCPLSAPPVFQSAIPHVISIQVILLGPLGPAEACTSGLSSETSRDPADADAQRSEQMLAESKLITWGSSPD